MKIRMKILAKHFLKIMIFHWKSKYVYNRNISWQWKYFLYSRNTTNEMAKYFQLTLLLIDGVHKDVANISLEM